MQIKGTHSGHRERVKEKILEFGTETLSETELMELLLFYIIPYKDTKEIAKEIVANSSGNVFEILNLDIPFLDEIKGLSGRNAKVFFMAILEVFSRMKKSKIDKKDVFSSWSEVVDYLSSRSAFLNHEEMRVLFLNQKNFITKDIVVGKGVVDEVSVQPRKIVELALLYKAKKVILSHNHPSGSANPSNEDKNLTANIFMALQSVDIELFDHIIIAKGEYFSFKKEGIL